MSFKLPDVHFAATDASAVEATMLADYQRVAGVTLYPGDPVRLFLEGLAYTLAVQNNLIDAAGKQNLLAFATGPHLDHLGALMNTPRLTETRAQVRLRFWSSALLEHPVLIPAGTRVSTPDQLMLFRTDTVTTIPAGSLWTEIMATAVEPGSRGNGLVTGQISLCIDPVPYVRKVVNVGVSLGGSDMESDTRYRERIQLAPEAYTCAGSEGSYRYHALRVHPDIAEVAVWSPQPGHVDVRPVLKGGELPDAALLARIREVLSADTVRPLTDTVTVAAPEPVPYTIRGGWYLRAGDAALSSSVQSAVTEAVEQFRQWQRSTPGRDINPTRLIALVERAGAKRVELTEPVFISLQGWQIARETEIAFAFLGIEDDLFYEQGGGWRDRAFADRLLRQCIRDMGHPVAAWLMWSGVRLCGWWFWKEK